MEDDGDVGQDVSEECNLEDQMETPRRESGIAIHVGMEFSTLDEAEACYAEYARNCGFATMRRNSRERVAIFCCHKEGVPRKKKKAMTNDDISIQVQQRLGKSLKVGCRASLHVSFNSVTELWRVTKFEDVHNHEMVSPNSLKFIRGHKKVTRSAKSLSEIFSMHNIPVGKVPDVLYSNPSDAEFTRKDCYNYMDSIRKTILDVGDAQSVYDYCLTQQEINPEFRYAFQLDEFDRLKNFFWIDPRLRKAYEIFGEVISFDTTYKTNKYNMPFAPFVGIDNHLHTVLFGCALLEDETEDTFVWLFNVWLNAMNGKHPMGIITDQDNAIMNAVAKVFPSSKHRLCLWHITKKFPEKLAHIYHEKSGFKQALNNCIYNSLTTNAFEVGWKKLLEDYNLGQNTWLQHLYMIRELWVPVFSKDYFFGGMNTTQRSESINAFFNSFVHSGTTLKEFVQKYSMAIERRYETFRRAEFDSRHKIPTLTLGMGIEEHASLIYTSEIFRLFHDELSSCLAYSREIIVDGQTYRTYRICSRKNANDIVMVELDMLDYHAKCQCKLFEYKGILCRHILIVYFENNIEQIPTHSILMRWTKDVARNLWEHSVAQNASFIGNKSCFIFNDLYDELSVLSGKSGTVLHHVKDGLVALISSAKSKLQEVESEFIRSSNPIDPSVTVEQEQTISIQDPNISQTKGRKKTSSHSNTSRIRGGLEIATSSTVRCSYCLHTGHNKQTCPIFRRNG